MKITKPRIQVGRGNKTLQLNCSSSLQNWTMESKGDFQPFKDLWENNMICSTTEALSETTGSIMKHHPGRGCHLPPVYFSIEIYLRWNLGPLHFLKKFTIEKRKST